MTLSVRARFGGLLQSGILGLPNMSISCHAQELLDGIRLILSRSSCASIFCDSFGKKSVSPCHLEPWTALSSPISFIGCPCITISGQQGAEIKGYFIHLGEGVTENLGRQIFRRHGMRVIPWGCGTMHMIGQHSNVYDQYTAEPWIWKLVTY